MGTTVSMLGTKKKLGNSHTKTTPDDPVLVLVTTKQTHMYACLQTNHSSNSHNKTTMSTITE